MARVYFIAAALGAALVGTAEAQNAPDCGNQSFSGPEMTCSCAPNARVGSVWGSNPYTTDSNICAAARHAGAIDENGGVVNMIQRPGQSSYTGSTVNGIKTSDWGSYGSSFEVLLPVAASTLPECGKMPPGVEEFACNCPANAPHGTVWGNDPYTADSSICTAAIHTGLIDQEGGDVVVLRIRGLQSYTGGKSFGVTTSDWGPYGESITFDWNR